MEVFDFKIVDELPALYHKDMDLIIISDLHLGLEKSMTSEGNYVPKFQLDSLKDDLRSIVNESKASRILINGDLKHEFKTTRYSEKEEIEDFLDFLEGLFEEIIIIKGNHDTFIENILDGQKIEFKDYHLESKVLFFHGHRLIEQLEADDYETIVIGHEHPALVLKDEIGVKEKVDCFLYGRTEEERKIIVMPAFSNISGGSKVNQVNSEDLLSPILRNRVDVSDMEAIAVSRDAGLFSFPEVGKF